MNKIILMTGTIILVYFILLVLSPDYEKNKKDFKNVPNRTSYLARINILSFLVSLMINFLIWGWFV